MSLNAPRPLATANQATLADVLERVLDQGIAITGDNSVSVAPTELRNSRIRLLAASVDRARELDINCWSNPYLNAQLRQLLDTNRQLQTRIEALEAQMQRLRQDSLAITD